MWPVAPPTPLPRDHQTPWLGGPGSPTLCCGDQGESISWNPTCLRRTKALGGPAWSRQDSQPLLDLSRLLPWALARPNCPLQPLHLPCTVTSAHLFMLVPHSLWPPGFPQETRSCMTWCGPGAKGSSDAR